MHTDQIYIARDGKSGMHVLVRILAVDDIYQKAQTKSATNGSTRLQKPELSAISNTVEIRTPTKSRKKTRTIICAAR